MLFPKYVRKLSRYFIFTHTLTFMEKLPQTIDEVLAALDAIIADAVLTNSPKGYFAALYRTVTAKVKEGIAQNRFEDGARMEKLDVIFANRYLVAYHAYHAQKPCSESWKLAFEEVENNQLLVLHHLFLGMGAHIMLDLGIASAQTCPKEEVHLLKKDFNEINVLLSSMVEEVEANLSVISPLFFLVDFFGGATDEKLAGFCIKIARTVAWENTLSLAPHYGTPDLEKKIHRIDNAAFFFGKTLLPRGMMKFVIRFVRFWEEKSVAKAIEVLRK